MYTDEEVLYHAFKISQTRDDQLMHVGKSNNKNENKVDRYVLFDQLIDDELSNIPQHIEIIIADMEDRSLFTYVGSPYEKNRIASKKVFDNYVDTTKKNVINSTLKTLHEYRLPDDDQEYIRKQIIKKLDRKYKLPSYVK